MANDAFTAGRRAGLLHAAGVVESTAASVAGSNPNTLRAVTATLAGVAAGIRIAAGLTVEATEPRVRAAGIHENLPERLAVAEAARIAAPAADRCPCGSEQYQRCCIQTALLAVAIEGRLLPPPVRTWTGWGWRPVGWQPQDDRSVVECENEEKARLCAIDGGGLYRREVREYRNGTWTGKWVPV